MKTIIFILVAACLLGTLVAEEWLSIGHLSMTFDEGAHLYGGYRHWMARDFGVNPEHPPLVKLVAAAPLLAMHIKQPHPPRFFFLAEQYIGGDQLLSENDPYLLLTRARMAASFFTFALAFFIFAAGWEMFGPPVALLALALFAFEPTVLAHGALVTTDMGVACFTFASVYAFYRYLRYPGLLRLVLCGLAVGLALSAKVSGVIVLPILVLISLAETAAAPVGRARKAGALLASLLAIGLIGYVVLWSFYTFRYSARPNGLVLVPSLVELTHMGPSPWQRGLVLHLAAWHLLPEGYLFAWTKLRTSVTASPGFLFGRIYPTGTWLYFPMALLIKSTLTLLVLLAAAPLVLKPFRRQAMILAIALFSILLACMPSDLDIGVRHVLAVYPFAIVLAAAAAWAIAQRSRIAAGALAALLLFQCASSLHAYPDYLPYSNEAFGGPSKTYRLLADSNVDWAQQLKEVDAWLAAHHTTDCWFAYNFLAGIPSYEQIPCRPLPSALFLLTGRSVPVLPPHIHGTLLISAGDASGVLWGPGSLNPYRQFQDSHPNEMIGNSILVYKGDFDVPLVAAQSHMTQVMTLLRIHQADAALKEAETAVAIDPQSPSIEAELGNTLLQMNKIPEAQQAFARAIQESKTLPTNESQAIATSIAKMMQPLP